MGRGEEGTAFGDNSVTLMSPVSRRLKIWSRAQPNDTTLSSRVHPCTRFAAEGVRGMEKRGMFGFAREKSRRVESEVRRQRVAGRVGCHSDRRRRRLWWYMAKRSVATGMTLGEGGREGGGGRNGGREGGREGGEERREGGREGGGTEGGREGGREEGKEGGREGGGGGMEGGREGGGEEILNNSTTTSLPSLTCN